VLLVRLVDEWASFLPAATFDAYKADLGLTYRAAALALLAIGPGAVAGSAVGILADTRSRRVLATVGAAIYAVALALFAAATSASMAVAGGFALALGSTLLVDTVEVALVDLCEADDPGGCAGLLERALLQMNVASGVGDLSGPVLVAGAAALGWSWRVPLWISAAALAIYAVLVAVSPLPPPPRDPSARSPGPFRDALAFARRPDIWWAGACGAVLVALDEAFIAYVIAYLRHDQGVSTATATLVAAVFVVGGLAAATWRSRALQAGPSSDRITTLRRAAAFMLAATLLLAVVPTPFAVALSGAVLGAATMSFWIPFQALTLQLVPSRAATVSALVGTIEMLGLAVTPVIGAISDTWGLRVGLTAYSCLPAVLVVLMRRAGRRQRAAVVRRASPSRCG
jgi:predicted MFS family arabinose efflux permease